jgi:hypothetical protein
MSLMSAKKLLMQGARKIRPQDVFATSLYTTSGANQKITNGLDLLGRGGLVWQKRRDGGANDHYLSDTVRGAAKELSSNLLSAESAFGLVQSFAPDGVTVGPAAGANVAWSFRRAKKFFDVVTYTGNGLSGRQISHGLGDVPGMIIVKARPGGTNWEVYHRTIGPNGWLRLNTTDATQAGSNRWNGTNPTATDFTVGDQCNVSGTPYVAYLFAQNPDLIDCGSYVGNGSPNGPNVSCGNGWMPQFLLIKSAGGPGGDWVIYDTARSLSNPRNAVVRPNTSGVEAQDTSTYGVDFLSTGFKPRNQNSFDNFDSVTYVYLAIRSPT